MKSNGDILIASSNKGKLKEFKKLFKDHKVFSLSDLDIRDAIEDGMITALQTGWTSPSFNLSLHGVNNAAGDPVEVTSLAFA